ncbi:cell wall synthesis protein CwsA [Mycolicibacterium celeriflavum]|uniref:Cell wall synthesis protein CwsA n=1 Tax=Mycolicibacterium celeriflavum TaxID=1249101 RepID=A0A1X0C368_MYCCF|nr:cell wall synthesis protein CwsA [Mycolicibacterium celeriflavum]MCV7238251.1 cell wall synthesis protein CwsA [Mycolicibacterium celeriflavum]ORA51061.1 cell wall synthesis protein CwsA [Mycolicibacterium celeriflavum]BBY44943.1 cell wall synthesis protein CwsA [Mycolicibacterium celeriflavum]
MSSKTDVRLTPGERLSRGLKYTAVGPVDVTRGALGLGITGAQSSAEWVGERYRRGRLKAQLSEDLATAQEIVSQALLGASPARTAKSKLRRRRLVLIGVGVAAVAGGAVAFSIVRRSTQPEPSPLPPSVEVAPRP